VGHSTHMAIHVTERIRASAVAIDEAYDMYMNKPTGNLQATETAVIRLFDAVQELFSIVSDLAKK
jgi:hypothetical protein